MNLEKINQLISQEMESVNKEIFDQLNSNVDLINQLSSYIINSGGKRIRPMMTILAAKAVGYKGKSHITIATLIEFIHTATLLHDDVIDESKMRRGKETANSVFGNAASILVGDFIYTRAFQMMIRLGSLKVLEVISEAVNIIAKGEIQQLMNINNPDVSEEHYMNIIHSKTACLFEAAVRCSGILSGCSDEQERGLKDYGRYIGTAFQLIDDVLDYSSESKIFGKNIGDDLNGGKLTLPLLHAIRNSSPKQQRIIRNMILKGQAHHLMDLVFKKMVSCGSLEWTRIRAQEEASKAISALKVIPDNLWRDALIGLAHTVVQRDH